MPYANLPGVHLWFTDTGGDGTPVVLLHANSGNTDSWEQQIPAFTAAGYRCIAYDRLGYGRTEPDPSSGPPRCASDDLEGLVDQLGLGPFHLVSTAGGSTPAVDYAVSHQDRLRSLVIADCAGGAQDADYLELVNRNRIPEIRAIPRVLRELSSGYRALHPDGVSRWLEIDHAVRHEEVPLQKQRNHVTFALVETLRVPTLAIAGDADFTIPPAVMRLFTAHLPDCEWAAIPEAGHCSFWERPDLWNRYVLDFLGRH